MAKLDTTLNMQDLTKNITVVVTIKKSRWYDFRLRLGCWIIAIGCHIAGIGMRTEEAEPGLTQDDFFYNGPPRDMRH